MADKRATTPLFDLLQQGRGRPTESRPAPQDGPAPAPREEPKGGGFGEAPIRIVGGVVHMPLVYAAVALVVAIAAILVAWSLGYQRGDRQARQEERLRDSALSPQSLVVEPGSGDTQRNQPQGGQPAGNRDTQPPNNNRPIPRVGQTPFITTAGPSNTDPRLDSHNYLILGAQLRADEVASAVAFLADRGLDCFGVIDPASRGRNDGPLFELWAGLGFPRGQADSDAAVRYREQVLAAGTAWRQSGGARSFDDAYWKLHQP